MNINTKHHEIPASHFSKKILNALKKKGIILYGSTWLPGKDGTYANGETGYQVEDNGTGRVFTFFGIFELAGFDKRGNKL